MHLVGFTIQISLKYICVDWEIYVAEKVRAFHSSISAKFKLEK